MGSLDFHPCQALTRHPNLPAFQWVWCQKRISKEPGLSILTKIITVLPFLQCQQRPVGEHGIPHLPGSNKVSLLLPNRIVRVGLVESELTELPQSNKAKSQSMVSGSGNEVLLPLPVMYQWKSELPTYPCKTVMRR